jgi:hypothetical protein
MCIEQLTCWQVRKRKKACLFAIVDIASSSCSLHVTPCSPNPLMVLLPKLIDKNQEVQPFVVIYSEKKCQTREWEPNCVFQEI